LGARVVAGHLRPIPATERRRSNLMTILLALFGFLLQTPAPASPLQPAPGNPVVVIETSAGAITLELYKDRAPVSVENFLQYARDGHYAGTIWHRVVPGYVIQGGGYTPELVEKTVRPPIQNEATNGLSNLRGTLAMARTRQARSATSQFYINVSNNAALDHRGFAPDDFGYAVFGRVLEGMDVVDRIAAVKTGARDGMDDVPVTPVLITSVKERK
jgi:peptidyl-prolyl cis-trans isomerase A (cyclophilin A)